MLVSRRGTVCVKLIQCKICLCVKSGRKTGIQKVGKRMRKGTLWNNQITVIESNYSTCFLFLSSCSLLTRWPYSIYAPTMRRFAEQSTVRDFCLKIAIAKYLEAFDGWSGPSICECCNREVSEVSLLKCFLIIKGAASLHFFPSCSSSLPAKTFGTGDAWDICVDIFWGWSYKINTFACNEASAAQRQKVAILNSLNRRKTLSAF